MAGMAVCHTIKATERVLSDILADRQRGSAERKKMKKKKKKRKCVRVIVL